MESQRYKAIRLYNHARLKSNLEMDLVHAIHKINYYTKGICPMVSVQALFIGAAEIACYFFIVPIAYILLKIHQVFASESIYLPDIFRSVREYSAQMGFLSMS